jgi:protease IV
LGLVDGFGGINDAIAEAARLAKLDLSTVKAVYLEKPPSFAQSIAEMIAGGEDDDSQQPGDVLSTLTRVRTLMLGQAVADATSLATGAAVQVRCLECPVSTVPVKTQSLTDLLVAWIKK